eukprot:GHVS01105277.1.p2 GENE.GHVS01105277.1~~GHVS01105277.1.p2  ORF type:complete len:101 (-),score=12.09 GHVS01105277.1:1501-1803(-)
MLVKVLLFSSARRIIGMPSLTVNITPSNTDAPAEVDDRCDKSKDSSILVSDLLLCLKEHYPALSEVLSQSVIAVDHAYVGLDYRFRDNQEVALIPPISGG